jgi:hypothetical protein
MKIRYTATARRQILSVGASKSARSPAPPRAASAPAFAAIWNNPDDDAYDTL